jgi:hypothetical protein
MRTFARTVCFTVLLTGVFVASAEADTVYTYTGDKFRYAQGAYLPGDRITGSFTLSDSFVPSMVNGAQPISFTNYSFTDGHQTLTQSNSTAIFDMSINGSGQIIIPGTPFDIHTPWGFNIRTPTSGIWATNGGDYGMIAWMGSATRPGMCDTTPVTICGVDPTISMAMIVGTGDQTVSGLPGTWTVQTVPEGGTTTLFLFAGLAGLTILTPFNGLKRVSRWL